MPPERRRLPGFRRQTGMMPHGQRAGKPFVFRGAVFQDGPIRCVGSSPPEPSRDDGKGASLPLESLLAPSGPDCPFAREHSDDKYRGGKPSLGLSLRPGTFPRASAFPTHLRSHPVPAVSFLTPPYLSCALRRRCGEPRSRRGSLRGRGSPGLSSFDGDGCARGRPGPR